MGRCIADYIKGSVDFKIADARKVSPLAQNKKRLDHVIMRSSVFVADMTYIVLSAKNIQCQKAGYDQKIFAEIASQNKRV